MTVGPASLDLAGRVAIVTGAAQGIGEATALALARCGADVAICDRDPDGLAATGADIEALGRRTHLGVLDVRDAGLAATFVADAVADLGRLDVLVNNAGGGFHSPFVDVSAKGEAALIAENFTQVTHLVRLVVPQLVDGGSIVHITSVEAHRAGPGFAIYSAMKSGLANLAQSLSLELAKQRIRVNCVAPDMIPTPGDAGLADASGASSEPLWDQKPWPDDGTPDDVAAAVLYLVSDLGRFVTGTTIHVDGGTHAAGGWKRRRSDGTWVL